LSDVDWDSLFVDEKVDESQTNISNKTADYCKVKVKLFIMPQTHVDTCIPNRYINVNREDLPWITSKLKIKLIRSKNKAT